MMRQSHIVLITDRENQEAREVEAQILNLSDEYIVDKIPIQLVRNILPGIRATPAIGVLFWATDLQGIVADVEAFASYIKGEDAVLSALETLGVKTEEEKSNEK